MTYTCLLCEDVGWVNETDPATPWDGVTCAGAACVCNPDGLWEFDVILADGNKTSVH